MAVDAHHRPIGVTDGARTRDIQYHKLALYQLNYGHHVTRLSVPHHRTSSTLRFAEVIRLNEVHDGFRGVVG